MGRLCAAVVVSLLLAASAHAQGQTLLTMQIPDTSPATLAWELGTRMSADVSGQIVGILYDRMVGDVGPHTGRIWNVAGVPLASVSIPARATPGRQETALVPPLIVPASSLTWVVSVDSPSGMHYAKTPGQFPLVNGHLSGVAGVYGPLGMYPGLTTPTGYYRDVRFVPNAVATVSVTADSTPGNFTAVTSGLPAGSYTLMLKDASGVVISASTPVVVGP